jgi:hypothetical protein
MWKPLRSRFLDLVAECSLCVCVWFLSLYIYIYIYIYIYYVEFAEVSQRKHNHSTGKPLKSLKPTLNHCDVAYIPYTQTHTQTNRIIPIHKVNEPLMFCAYIRRTHTNKQDHTYS